MNEIFGLIIGAGLTYYLVILVSTTIQILVSRRTSRKTAEGGNAFLPPISILKPVNGVEGNLRENLLSFINQDYPDFEIVIGIQSTEDPAIELVESLRDEYPGKKIKYVVSDRVLGYNPKINNLYGMMPLAENDYMVISDSNVLVETNYLRENVKCFADRKVGLVTNLIKGVGGEGAGALFENLHLNSFVIGNVGLLRLAKREIVVGKSIFFRKSEFDRLGGIWELRNYLAEDYIMGRMYKKSGYKVVVSPRPITTTNHSWTFKRFLNRHTRWAQLRWNLNKAAYAGELILNFPFWSMLFALVSGPSLDAVLVWALCWGMKIVGDSLMNTALETGIGLRQCVASPVKDLVIAFTWPVPLVYRNTKWRGNRVRISHNTLLLPTQDQLV